MSSTVSRCRTVYGGRPTVTLLPGDGIGPELTAAVEKVFGSLNVPVDFETINFHAQDANAEQKVAEALTSLRRNGVGLKGVFSTPQGRATQSSYNAQIRAELDLYANVVHAKTPVGVQTRHSDVDVVIVRQNTEAEYSGLEHEISPGVVESLKVISREESLRIAKFAFDYATQNGRKKVTAVHKANIMKLGDGLFLQCCKEVSEQYPNIAFEGMIVDNTSMQMVSRPQQFDVLVTPNLYGNIVGNIAAGLVGGDGLVSGFNLGDEFALFEPGARQMGEELAGKGVANPICMIKSSALMLHHLGLSDYGTVIEQAVDNVIKAGSVRTPDLGGSSTTTEMAQAICDEAAAIASA
jgi:isocitrate dehydrogenase (NAD+)